MKTVVSMFSVLLLTACGNLADLAVTDISTLTLSYSDFSGSLDPAEVQRIPPKGTLVRLAAGRDVEYAIAPQTDGIAVNPYGVVLVDSDAPVNPTEYTVTATGAGAYANTQTATVTIKVVVPSGPTLDGKVTYDPIGTVFGTQAVGNVPYNSSLTGSDGSVLPLLRYTASDGSNELASGITIAEDTGIVTVAGTADARTETHYTVMVSADGYQPGMLNGAVSITVDQKDFSNAPIFDANSLSAAVVSQTAASHSILHTGSGYTFGTDYDLSIAPVSSNQNTTGAITIAATGDIGIGSGVTVADAGTYTVTATGKGNYSGVSTASFQLFIQLSTVLQLSVADKIFTKSTTGHYTDLTGGLTAGTDYQLRIEPAADASIDNAGLISFTSPTGGASYTVIAEGIGNYRGEIRDSFTLRESLSSAGFKLSVRDHTVFSGAADTVDASITNSNIGHTLSLVDSGGTGNPAGMSIDASGKISIPSSIDANDSGEYTVIAAGTGNYGGTVRATFNLTVSDSDFIYSDIFVTAAVTANGGTSWQTFNAPPVNVTPRWRTSPAGTVNFPVPNPPGKPGWLTIDPQSGELTGTPDAIGFGSFIIEASLSGAAETTTVNWFVGVQPTNKDELKTAVQVELDRYKNMGVTEYQDLRAIDTSLMTDMSDLFYVNSSNQPQYALDFNGDISSWDVSNVTDMSKMFCSDGTTPMAFTGVFESSGSIHSISEWDVSSVTNMEEMFSNADNFGELNSSQYDILAEWDVSNVVNMAGMFKGNATFNQDISAWNVSSVTDMTEMFNSASGFNRDISDWNVGRVTTMRSMFMSADDFNQDISKWNVSNVTTMQEMFAYADDFNQNISEWDVGSVTDMRSMFNTAGSFNQDLNAWSVDSSVNKAFMFNGSGVAQLPGWY